MPEVPGGYGNDSWTYREQDLISAIFKNQIPVGQGKPALARVGVLMSWHGMLNVQSRTTSEGRKTPACIQTGLLAIRVRCERGA